VMHRVGRLAAALSIIALTGCGSTAFNTPESLPSTQPTAIQWTCNLSQGISNVPTSAGNQNEPSAIITIALTNNTGEGVYINSVSYTFYDSNHDVVNSSNQMGLVDSSGNPLESIYIPNNGTYTLTKSMPEETWPSGQTCGNIITTEGQLQMKIIQASYTSNICIICGNSSDKNHWWPCYTRYLHRIEWRALRQMVFERDKYTCLDCGYYALDEPQINGNFPRLECAHVHGSYKEFFKTKDIKHLRTLCIQCHWYYDRKEDRPQVAE
jgi:hypothetical protein